MSTRLHDQTQAEMHTALSLARETLHQIAENEGDLGWNQDFWNEGGEGYQTLEQINAALAAAKQGSTLEQMAFPQVFVLLQESLATAYQAVNALNARKAAGPGVGVLLDTLLAESLKLGSPGANQAGNLPAFQALLATLHGVVAVAMDLADACDE